MEYRRSFLEYCRWRLMGFGIIVVVLIVPMAAVALLATAFALTFCGEHPWPTAIFLSGLGMFCFYRFLRYRGDDYDDWH